MKTIPRVRTDAGNSMWVVLFGVLAGGGALTLFSGCTQAVPVSDIPGTVTIFFDGADAEDGDTDFTFEGASFSGGRVRTVGNPSLYGSGRFSYEVEEGSTVTVAFDAPIDFLELVLIRSGGDTVLTAFDAEDNEVGSISAGTGRVAQTVELMANAVRVEVVHTGSGSGWIDNFTFRIVAQQNP